MDAQAAPAAAVGRDVAHRAWGQAAARPRNGKNPADEILAAAGEDVESRLQGSSDLETEGERWEMSRLSLKPERRIR
ncbi:hypothetical protein FKV24_002355 [Lysobacter maris]|uniref:Uncharacterized protein n=1 Tax=Marilutibacter maris TaxID=1605891 RepID=A0A508B577_9GAMM|nr:hypothetical protein FKV24_002355 [Lysobacter maris]